ncbi:MAG: acetylornithine deacetylase (ArgE) [Acidobacteria bacterium 13_1_20CM_3_53_8]|nr:MAG: acetylornithine deacetylase (ArgE) [Acidobacteria bacterium 13_1_20CM_3_53_8]
MNSTENSLQETLAQLVAFDSVSSRSNTEIINYLAERTEGYGLIVKRFSYADENGVEKENLIAIAGADSSDSVEVELALVGHTDTVPYDLAWNDALRLSERDGKLFGRGACDTKAFIAASLAAMVAVDLKDLRRPLALIFTADEEIGCIGAKHLADARAIRPRYSIVGEPTCLQPIRAGKGYCLAEITVRGREGHSAYPQLGASAIFRAARLVNRIERSADELKRDERAGFDPPYTTLNVGIIKGGKAKNIIAGECTFTLEWRPVPGQNSKRVLDMVNAAIEEERKSDDDFDAEVRQARLQAAMETPEDSPLVTFLEEETGRAAGTIAFATEAPQMAELGAQSVVFGPGDIRVAHRTGEFVSKEELQSASRILTRAVEHFCM